MNPARTASALLAAVRQTRMVRGGRHSRGASRLKEQMSLAIEGRGVLPRVASRVANQLVAKFDSADLSDAALWCAIGDLLRREIERLQACLGLVDRQIIVALPKLSARHIEDLFEELRAADPRIARTILNVALDAAQPVAAARRYLAEFHRVADQLQTIDPDIARTVANATFMARMPHRTAMAHITQFAALARQFQDDVEFARTVARAAFRAPNPLKAAKGFVADYQAVVNDLTSAGVEPTIARSLAGIASTGADPIPTAHTLLQQFEDILALAQKTHAWVARSIALSACRATDPVTTARAYIRNYDAIVRAVNRTDPSRAHQVAAQTFRSDNPLRWATRYLAELQERDRVVGGSPSVR